MKYPIYVIKDMVAEEAGPPFICRNDEVAKRQTEQILKYDNKYLHIEDYQLYKIGTYDSDTMYIETQFPQNIEFEFDKSLADSL